MPVSDDPSVFLDGIAQKDLKDILSRGRHVRLGAGETLFKQGDPAQRCHYVLTGRVKLTKLHEQGKEVIIRYVESGLAIAAVSVFREKEYPVTAEAVGTAEVVGWDKQTMEGLMLEYPPLALNLLRIALDRLEDIQNRYLELTAEQVEQRIGRALLRIMQQSGSKTPLGIEIGFPLSRQELADYTGTTVYTVSRTLSAWEKKGWIKSGREKITISNPHELVNHIENA